MTTPAEQYWQALCADAGCDVRLDADGNHWHLAPCRHTWTEAEHATFHDLFRRTHEDLETQV